MWVKYLKRNNAQHQPKHNADFSSPPGNFVLDMAPETCQGIISSKNCYPDFISYPHHPSQIPSNDFKVLGFRNNFKQENLLKFIRCSGSNCKTLPRPESYAFCQNNHIYCVQCAENLPFCWVRRQPDGPICQKKFYKVYIAMYTTLLMNYQNFLNQNNQDWGFHGRQQQRPEISREELFERELSKRPYYCRFTGCTQVAESFEKFVVHLKNRHRSVYIERSIPTVALRIPWNVPRNVENYTWIPAVLCVSEVYFLVVCRIYFGSFYQFIYVEDRRRSKNEIFIWSGFELTQEGITHLKEDPPNSLSTPEWRILDNCLSMNLEDFLEKHLTLDDDKQNYHVTFDLDIALF